MQRAASDKDGYRRDARGPMVALLALACVYTLHVASNILIPLTIAVMLALTLTPLVRGLQKLHLPRPLAAGIIVLLAVGGMAGSVNLLWAPASDWVASAPEKFSSLEPRLRELRAPLERIRTAGNDIAKVADDEPADNRVRVEVEGETLMESALAAGPRMAASLLAILFLLYFLLGYGDRLLNKVVHLTTHQASSAPVAAISLAVQQRISRFLLIISLVNAGIACFVSAVLYVVGFPSPVLWGVVAGLLNFAPYVGAVITTVLLTVVGLLNLDSLGLALAVPAGFLIFTALEGQLITPTLLGRQMAISPYMVFLAITFWGWLWGIAGALIAVPILVITKIVAESFPGLHWLDVLIGREGDDAPPITPGLIVTSQRFPDETATAARLGDEPAAAPGSGDTHVTSCCQRKLPH